MYLCTRNQGSHKPRTCLFSVIHSEAQGPFAAWVPWQVFGCAGVCAGKVPSASTDKDWNTRAFQSEPDTATLKPETWTSKFSTPQKEWTILHPSKWCLSSLCLSYSLLSLSHTHTLFLILSLPLHFKPWEKPGKRSLPTKGPFRCIVFSS